MEELVKDMAPGDFVIIVNAVFFLGMGLVGLLHPARIPAYFSVTELTADFRNEVRAVYGGVGVFVGGMLLYAQFFSGAPQGIILTVAVALMGMAFGRLFSYIVEKRMGFWPGVFLSVELLLCSSLLWVSQNSGV